MRYSKKIVCAVVMLAACTTAVMAQNSRSYIKKMLTQWGSCRNMALTETNGDVALYGRNGAAWQNIPTGLADTLQQMHDEEQYIDDVQLTEEGRWLVVGDMIYWDGISASLESKIRELVDKGDTIIAVSFNDYGDWIVVSDKSYSSSDTDIQSFLQANAKRYGFLRSACVTNEGIIVVYEDGFAKRGYIPDDCWDALDYTDLDIHRLKVSGDSWFFADQDGNYEGYL